MQGIKDFGRYIASHRRKAGMTQEQFATKLGITPQAVSKWENGIGYPDISLFPSIAALLGVSIESLFTGSTSPESDGTPSSLQGLPLVGVYEQVACYSLKTPLKQEESAIVFTDGSRADLKERTVHNCGTGEILLTDTHELPSGLFDSLESYEEDLEAFHSLSLAVAMPCDIDILPAPDGMPRLEAVGSPCFVGALHVHQRGASLKVAVHSLKEDTEEEQNRLTVYTPPTGDALDVQLGGYSECRILTDYRTIRLQLGGCPSVSLPRLTTCEQLIVNGGGIVDMAGYANLLVGNVNGFAEIHAGGLAVERAELYTQAAAVITIGQIRGESIERLHKGTVLTVHRRGA